MLKRVQVTVLTLACRIERRLQELGYDPADFPANSNAFVRMLEEPIPLTEESRCLYSYLFTVVFSS